MANTLRSAIALSPNYKYWAFGTIAIGTLGSVVDHGSVNIALPTVAGHFRTDLPTVQWVVIAYALTISALLLPMGRLSDLIGRKEVYVIGILVFVAGAALAGASSNLIMLILARVLQGCGAAMTQGTGMAIVTSVFPPDERGKAIGLIMLVVGAGATAGPAVGGLLVDAIGWRYVFFINVPLGLVAAAAALAVLRERRTVHPQGAPRTAFDWPGAALSTGAMVILLTALTNGHKFGWTSPLIFAAMFSFPALLGAFVWQELRSPNPMLDVRLFARRTFSSGITAAFLGFLGSGGVLVLMPFYLQGVLGYSPKWAGLIMMPGALFMAMMGPVSGGLSDRYGRKWFATGGLACSAAGLFLLSRLTEESSLALVMPALILYSSGMGLFYSPNSSSVLSAVEMERFGIVSSLLHLVRNAANTTSLALATAIVVATMGAMGFEPSLEAVREAAGPGVGHAFTVGLRNAFLVMMGLVLVGAAVSAIKGERLMELGPNEPV